MRGKGPASPPSRRYGPTRTSPGCWFPESRLRRLRRQDSSGQATFSWRAGPRATAAETGSAGVCAANRPKLGLLSDAGEPDFSLRFKTLIVLTLRYQRAAFSGVVRSLRPAAPRAHGGADSLPKSRRRLYRDPAGRDRLAPRRQVDGGAGDLRLGVGFGAFALGPCDGGHRLDRRIVFLHASRRQPA